MLAIDPHTMPSHLWFMFGLGCGICVGALCLLIASISDWRNTRRQIKKEIRIAHDKGYSDGRRWRGYQKVWFDAELESIKGTLARLEKIQEQTDGEGR